MDIKSATEEMAVSYTLLSLRDDKEETGIFYKLESADFSEDTLTVTYGKYCKTPIVEKEYDSILGQWEEKITGYEDVLQGKILSYFISGRKGVGQARLINSNARYNIISELVRSGAKIRQAISLIVSAETASISRLISSADATLP